ncbi:hypothetical protein C7459_107133 [Tumebacillus permanentifrigoris]|uniref:Uncharacterized protein n=1 Tax=Tumebacillus permanentifrigoris TaxID=378543 RepID=A0A316DVU4_9BACL|nr:hypothetical protein C7459_107133 [Tumebacillus permanentifrigoris]
MKKWVKTELYLVLFFAVSVILSASEIFPPTK